MKLTLKNNFFKEKDADKKATIYEAYIANTPADKLNAELADIMKTQIATAYNTAKNIAMFTKWVADLKPANKESIYNDIKAT